ncbi:MFS transporter [Pigmentiphaga litoralis]|uniref:MFS family permease n=1 Tax=Pigmentiphaga litoralis TaxID=516702 RepID=A0A7Y9IRH9_9BURK|nr:MFS transporter [Pigmentiphaga litoralis]NYE24732.1 MFS family permease [Pigmentiphaga litoralis]NYE81654.1 MFS family permease [Pigmentiphaga litoralis]
MTAVAPAAVAASPAAPAAAGAAPAPARRSLRALDMLAFFAPDIQGGVGPFLVVFMAGTLAWDPQRIGTVMFVSALVALIVQAPAGALIDRVPNKPRWVAAAITLIAVCLVVMANWPSYYVILGGQSIIVAAGTLVAPAIASTSLGMVGRRGMDARIGRNAAITAAGTLVWAFGTGLVGQYYGPHAMFFYAVAMAVPTVVAAMLIRQRDVDVRLARGADSDAPSTSSTPLTPSTSSPPANPTMRSDEQSGNGESSDGTTLANASHAANALHAVNATHATDTTHASKPLQATDASQVSNAAHGTNTTHDTNTAHGTHATHTTAAPSAPPASVSPRWYDHRLVILLASAFLFHLANAAMLTLVAQKVGTQAGTSATVWLSGGVIITQLVTIPIGLAVGRYAPRLARKPIFLVGFAVLPIRGLLYLLADSPSALLSLQVLDGIGAGVFGVMLTLMIGDLTRGSGHFSLALGIGAACVGLGAALSNLLAGTIAHLAGYDLAFLVLAGVAAAALILFAVGMPETRHADASQNDAGPRPGATPPQSPALPLTPSPPLTPALPLTPTLPLTPVVPPASPAP